MLSTPSFRPSVLMAALVVLPLAGCEKAPAPKPVKPVEPVKPKPEPKPKGPSLLDNPKSCKTCHAQVVAEWEDSLHARAHHGADPIYGAMRALRVKKQGEAITGKCSKCHNPRDLKDPESAVAQTGVSCAACHNVKAVHLDRGLGADALDWDKRMRVRSARDLRPGASSKHKTGKALAAMADGRTLCLACHGEVKTPADQPACTTGPEADSLAARASCVSCHMPELDGPSGVVSKRRTHRSHRFPGPHRAFTHDDPSVLKAAVKLSGELKGKTLTVKLQNVSGHAFPTGFPGRMAVLSVEALDDKDALIWANWNKNAMAEAPDSVFNKVYVDKDGKPAPAAFATELKRDNRLKPAETRELSFTLPKVPAVVVVSLRFHLLPPPLAQTLGIADKPEGGSVEVLAIEVAPGS